MQPRLAIIGAGLSVARALDDAGLVVQLFDKSRGSGGRLSSKRSSLGDLDMRAEYFTARDPAFRQAVAAWQAQDWVACCSTQIFRARQGHLSPSPDQQQRQGGTPRMSALTRDLLGILAVPFECRIREIFRGAQHWQRLDAEGQRPRPTPCWRMSRHWRRRRPASRWNRSGRWPGAQHGIGHASAGLFCPGQPAGLGRAQLELPADAVIDRLCAAFASLLQSPLPAAEARLALRWLYARPVRKSAVGALTDPQQGIFSCADWCLAGRAEGAWPPAPSLMAISMIVSAS